MLYQFQQDEIILKWSPPISYVTDVSEGLRVVMYVRAGMQIEERSFSLGFERVQLSKSGIQTLESVLMVGLNMIWEI